MKCWLCHEININVSQAAVPTYKLISAVWSRQGQCNLSASITEWDNRSVRQSKSNMASSWQCLIIFELKCSVTCRQEGHGDYKQRFREMMEGNGWRKDEAVQNMTIWRDYLLLPHFYGTTKHLIRVHFSIAFCICAGHYGKWRWWVEL